MPLARADTAWGVMGRGEIFVSQKLRFKTSAYSRLPATDLMAPCASNPLASLIRVGSTRG
jgi:hypothetical protein